MRRWFAWELIRVLEWVEWSHRLPFRMWWFRRIWYLCDFAYPYPKSGRETVGFNSLELRQEWQRLETPKKSEESRGLIVDGSGNVRVAEKTNALMAYYEAAPLLISSSYRTREEALSCFHSAVYNAIREFDFIKCSARRQVPCYYVVQFLDRADCQFCFIFSEEKQDFNQWESPCNVLAAFVNYEAANRTGNLLLFSDVV